MTDERPSEVDEEELETQNGEELPERETMMVLDPGGGIGLDPIPWPDGEAPDDRYEQ
jgi:hypothetical protein